MKSVHMCYIGVTEGKNETLKKEGKMRIRMFIFNYTIQSEPVDVHKFHNPKASSC